MKARYKLLGLSSVLLLLGFGLLLSTRNVSAAAEGKISGTIKLDGTAPHQKPIDMSKEPTCAKIHEGHPVTTETVVIGSGAGLQNVVVYISEGLPVGAASQVSAETPSFDQKGCQYIPHVLALDVNQHFKVTNSDQTSHNIHPMPTPGGANHECNIHPWMSGYMAVVKGPYGVTDNSGSFTINNVPPGDYTLTAWQESYGTQTLKVSVGAGKPATADFTFKAK